MLTKATFFGSVKEALAEQRYIIKHAKCPEQVRQANEKKGTTTSKHLWLIRSMRSQTAQPAASTVAAVHNSQQHLLPNVS